MGMTTNERIAELIIRHLNGQITSQEESELKDWAAESDHHRQVVESFLVEEQLAAGIRDHWVEDRIWARLDQLTTAHVVPMPRFTWLRYAAAACILLLLGGVVYWYRSGKTPLTPSAVVAKQDVAAPKLARAIITLGNGRQIALDSVASGTLAQQGQVKVIKLADGQLAYTGRDQEVVYNTLTNPRGSRVIDLTLSDGTHVWLNAASSVRYPVAFIGDERKVEVTGEAYFEVAKNASRPFKVLLSGGQEVEVLGTNFNVNAFDDEPEAKITLLEGSVRVKEAAPHPLVGVNTNEDKPSVVLKPGQQALLVARENTNNGKNPIEIKNEVDLQDVLAWKNGRFAFEGVGIQEVMRSVARWYDVQVEYQGTPTTQHFRGGISRSADVSQVFKMLETTGVVNFTIQNKKIIVMP
jgi:ferric-dicitrate binding protein FerR (iron transport regulator)